MRQAVMTAFIPAQYWPRYFGVARHGVQALSWLTNELDFLCPHSGGDLTCGNAFTFSQIAKTVQRCGSLGRIFRVSRVGHRHLG
jgi:hypothetical protein